MMLGNEATSQLALFHPCRLLFNQVKRWRLLLDEMLKHILEDAIGPG
jgi:hypothetical protein